MTNADRERLTKLRRKAAGQFRGVLWIESDIAFLLRLLDQPRGKHGQFYYTTEDLDHDRASRRSVITEKLT